MSRSAWRAFATSSSTMFFAIIAISADSILHARGLEVGADALEVVRGREDLDGVRLGVDVVRARVDRDEGDLVGIHTLPGHRDETALLELPRDRPRTSELAARLGEHGADLRRGAVAVVRLRLDEDRDPARAVALVEDLLVLVPVATAGRALDRALDVVHRHVDRPGLVDGEAEPVVGVGVAAADLRGDDDLAGDLREERAALRVVGALLALDRGPFGVSGHARSIRERGERLGHRGRRSGAAMIGGTRSGRTRLPTPRGSRTLP